MRFPPIGSLIRPPIPPEIQVDPVKDPYLAAVVAELSPYLQQMWWWANDFAGNLIQQSAYLDRVLNGGVEFPAPFSSIHTGNIHVIYKLFLFNQTSTPIPSAAVELEHGFGETPRSWSVESLHSAGDMMMQLQSLLILDQILSSTYPSPLVAGYLGATVDASNPRIIRGSAAFSGGWVDNLVRIGDQIALMKDLAGGSTASNSANGNTVTRAAGTFSGEAKPGWYFRYVLAPENDWRTIAEVSGSSLKVTTPYRNTHAGAAYQTKAVDQLFRTVSAITAGAPGNPDTLTLDPKGPGTDIPVGQLSCEYVIRRPMNDKTFWVRVMSESPGIVAATLRIS